MKLRRIALVCVTLVLAGVILDAEIARRVGNVEELLRAVGPERTLLLRSGTYLLSDAELADTGYVSFLEVQGGRQVVISGAWGLTIRGEEGVRILVRPSDGWVLTFEGARDLTLEGLALGHAESGGCGAGVLRLVGCEGVRIESCDLFGSGTVGVELEVSSGVTLASSVIRDCATGAVHATESGGLSLQSCDLRDNAAYPLFGFSACEAVSIEGCAISGNRGETFLAVEGDPAEVLFADCSVSDNVMERFAAGDYRPVMRDVRWQGNEFAGIGAAPEESVEAERWEFFAHLESGFGFEYPGSWRLDKGTEGFVSLVARDEGVAMVLVPLYELTANESVGRDAAKVMARAIETLRSAAEESGDALTADQEEPLIAMGEDLATQIIRGVTRMDGEERPYVLRLIAARGRVHAAMVVFRDVDVQALHYETVESVLSSFAPVDGDR